MAKKVLSLILNGLLVISLVSIGWIVYQRIEGKQPNLFGYQIYNVLSGSMEPTIQTGSLVVVQGVKPEAIESDDVITFQDETGNITTHRVVSVQEDSYVTKGDANEIIDPMAVMKESLIGKVVFHIPYLGEGFLLLQEHPMIILIFVIGFGFLSLGYRKIVSNNN